MTHLVPCPRCRQLLEVPRPVPAQIRCVTGGAVIKNSAGKAAPAAIGTPPVAQLLSGKETSPQAGATVEDQFANPATSRELARQNSFPADSQSEPHPHGSKLGRFALVASILLVSIC